MLCIRSAIVLVRTGPMNSLTLPMLQPRMHGLIVTPHFAMKIHDDNGVHDVMRGDLPLRFEASELPGRDQFS